MAPRRITEQSGNTMPVMLIGMAQIYAWLICLLGDVIDLSVLSGHLLCDSEAAGATSVASDPGPMSDAPQPPPQSGNAVLSQVLQASCGFASAKKRRV